MTLDLVSAQNARRVSGFDNKISTINSRVIAPDLSPFKSPVIMLWNLDSNIKGGLLLKKIQPSRNEVYQ